MQLVQEVFDEFVAPDYSSQGRDEFYKFANEKSMAERTQQGSFIILAYHLEKLLGIIEVMKPAHISLFFVKKGHQRSGIGKALFAEVLKRIYTNGEDKEITVKSALHSVDFYRRLGFVAQDGEQCINGIRFIPMKKQCPSISFAQ